MGGFDARDKVFVGENWPSELGGSYKAFVLDFQEKTHAVLLKLLRAIALGIGWPEEYFSEVSQQIGCILHIRPVLCAGSVHMTYCCQPLQALAQCMLCSNATPACLRMHLSAHAGYLQQQCSCCKVNMLHAKVCILIRSCTTLTGFHLTYNT